LPKRDAALAICHYRSTRRRRALLAWPLKESDLCASAAPRMAWHTICSTESGPAHQTKEREMLH
jgi:hypothetical protein